jgi:N-acetylglucosaminyl-diphospho-decaprenol L-rhamnosyltransferase
MTSGMSALVSVAVVSWNTRSLLGDCLRSLADDVEAGRAEAWVVDNASTDGSAEMVRDEFPWAQLVAGETNLGFGAAVNLIAQRAGGEWIAPANADVALIPGALEVLVEAGRRDPRAGVVAPRLLLPDGSTEHSVHHFPTLPFGALYNSGAHRLVPGLGDHLCLPGRWDPERRRRVDWAIGAFLAIRRTAWDEVGGFDPRQWMYAEDLDLGWRLARRGWHARYEPSAVAHHRSGASTAQAWGAGVTEQWLRSTYAWMLRRRGPARTRAYAAVNVAGARARAGLLAPAAKLAPARFGPRRADLREWSARHRRTGLAARAELESHR